MNEIRYTSGPYVCRVDEWRELWRAVWMFVALAIYMREHGRCTCGCTIMECDYCAEECLDD
jgi:hypothetical protein